MMEIGRIRFRPLRREDLRLLEVWENCHVCTLYSRGKPLVFKNMDDIEREYEEYIKDTKRRKFVVEMVSDDKVMGFSSYKDNSHRIKDASIGAFIGERDYWNKGLGKEITMGLCEMLFFHLGYDRISAWTSSINPRAINVLDAVGFVHTGTARRSGYIMGNRIDWYMYDLLREEYMPVRDRLLERYIEGHDAYIRDYCTLSTAKSPGKHT